MLKQRVFKPILKTSFKTTGTGTTIYPLSKVTVDGDPFRLTGISRKYTAESNEFVMDFNAEWLGG
jgi:carbohydrate-binding DOMON domain-containing protein